MKSLLVFLFLICLIGCTRHSETELTPGSYLIVFTENETIQWEVKNYTKEQFGERIASETPQVDSISVINAANIPEAEIETYLRGLGFKTIVFEGND